MRRLPRNLNSPNAESKEGRKIKEKTGSQLCQVNQGPHGPHLAGRPATESPSGPAAPHSARAPGPTFPAEQPRQRGPAPRLTQGGGEQPSAGACAPRHGPEGSRGHGRQQRCSDVPPNDSLGRRPGPWLWSNPPCAKDPHQLCAPRERPRQCLTAFLMTRLLLIGVSG